MKPYVLYPKGVNPDNPYWSFIKKPVVIKLPRPLNLKRTTDTWKKEQE